ncbi:tRNA (cytosine(72)-C(5))-methyltransferase NSUN6 [Hyla sarda]|uniref:tRNA (cytosine(72)-C(5))-methyltransferase NSUN6 n=1 Tax=Hyla sarda TaxID=327740 RepID=UPI0024C2DAD2|nr:tRNA (cytosine(72)-C(5))-methyltransferase NSUN6 [Hyla sarda]XP_056375201.1 tRNA (cytosine(72)-C(5))-methyltransferase NSUN6 [Hyla sarda]XP_056375202.1 tRNA (cytosine(72)-C(5))-methyltransferase NSUN6 [Hyla sarda]XP_056375203.1 tRNA (cytosine(72)-C(5))-methyltransferase NSUN6 [Hyla sarda]XP_056375204.1 tRNA (cytosine(72)-C(5))-methyltransferase NSUN6 [Hyla sarda]XP_056375205.1 tRNA (cytosine(72)-C(5))-methyltransferase NSUN6 [Hyla sarda]XP_056375206.1 tRNA (cytosine(72)-C(5))-methyltransfe
MSFFPKIRLRKEVEDYLRNVYHNNELVAALGADEAERRFVRLQNHLSHPPSFTTVRVNTRLISVDNAKQLLREEIDKQFPGGIIPIHPHPQLSDLLLIPVIGPRRALKQHPVQVIVGAQCGSAVLRGAHVYSAGIMSASKWMKVGDKVSVFSDIEGQCKRGATEFDGAKVFVGNGISELSRSDIFCSNVPIKGKGIRMTEPLYLSPSFDNVLPEYIFLQNLPSAVVSHVLNPHPGERVLDMCAAPGGKTTHIASLMNDQGEVIAMDKIANKVEKIKQNASALQLSSIQTYCYNSTKAVNHNTSDCSQGPGPPFPPESFDHVLLDAPCSGMGQRPNMACALSLKELTSYQPLQRKLFSTAVSLLKPGGTLVYSTCTITLSENEEQVAWALKTFPCLQLQAQDPHIGGEGMLGAGLSPDELKLLQRFDPSLANLCYINDGTCDGTDRTPLANTDTIGFFIAKFVKTNS